MLPETIGKEHIAFCLLSSCRQAQQWLVNSSHCCWVSKVCAFNKSAIFKYEVSQEPQEVGDSQIFGNLSVTSLKWLPIAQDPNNRTRSMAGFVFMVSRFESQRHPQFFFKRVVSVRLGEVKVVQGQYQNQCSYKTQISVHSVLAGIEVFRLGIGETFIYRAMRVGQGQGKCREGLRVMVRVSVVRLLGLVLGLVQSLDTHFITKSHPKF